MSVSETVRPWRYALASAIGSSHLRSGTPCQDASAGEVCSPAGVPAFLGVVSDGAGSAPQGEVGARHACRLWRDEAARVLSAGAGVALLDRTFAEATLARFQVTLARLARRARRPLRDYACTLLFAAVDEHAAAFVQIGDGAMVVAGPDAAGYAWVFWPEQGEYANQTCFATESDAARHLRHELRTQRVDELALFTDGLQNLVLDKRARRAHAGFFEPMFASVRRAAPGASEALSRALAGFLRSRTVEARTDDDKSLVLASRRAPQPRPALPVLPATVGSAALAEPAVPTSVDAPRARLPRELEEPD